MCMYMHTHIQSPVVKLAALRIYCLLVVGMYYKNVYIKNTGHNGHVQVLCMCLVLLKTLKNFSDCKTTAQLLSVPP